VNDRQQRLIVVLGYSDGGQGALHPVCSERLAHAAALATPDDVVVLSGWAKVPGTRSEAELMAAAWAGRHRELVVDHDARTTVGNANSALLGLCRTQPNHVVVVTSRWHAPRAAAAFRWQLRGSGVAIVTSSPRRTGGVRDWVREVPCWAMLPLQLALTENRSARFATSPAPECEDDER